MIRVDRLPVTSTSMWTRAAGPAPSEVPLSLHFEVKAALGFDHAVIVGHRTRVERATRVGDRVGHHQELRRIGPERRTVRGPGRSWEIDQVITDVHGAVLQIETFHAVGYRPVAGVRTAALDPDRRPVNRDPGRWTDRSISRAAAALRVWTPVHHDIRAAQRAGLAGVIACTQHLAAAVEWAVVDVVGAGSVVADLSLRMRRPVVAGSAPQLVVERGPGRGGLQVLVRQHGRLCCVATVTTSAR